MKTKPVKGLAGEAIAQILRTFVVFSFASFVGSQSFGGPTPPLLESFTLSASGTPQTSSTVLAAGQNYWLLAQGTYVRSASGLRADAEYAEQTANVWLEDAGGGGEPNHDIVVDLTGRDWLGSPLPSPDPFLDFETFQAHAFSPSHQYWLPLIGNGTSVGLAIFDQFASDNSGSLVVGLYAPEPTSLSVLALVAAKLLARRKSRRHAARVVCC